MVRKNYQKANCKSDIYSNSLEDIFEDLAYDATPERMKDYYEKKEKLEYIIFDNDDYVKSSFWNLNLEYYHAL